MRTKEIKSNVIVTELYSLLTRRHIAPYRLSSFKPIILTNALTLLYVLKLYLFEVIQNVKLSNQVVTITPSILPLELAKPVI